VTKQGEVRKLPRVRTGVWLIVSWVLLSLASACETSARTIALDPLPVRRDAGATDDDDGGVPDGALACASDADCDDGVACTTDVCLEAGYCRSTSDNTLCSDGVFCNGDEVCEPAQGCRATGPRACADLSACTIDRCDEEAQTCVHAPRDFDQDGEVDFRCAGGSDCDDFDDRVGTLVAELCADAIDNDCDQTVDERECGRPQHDTCDDALDVSAGGVFDVSARGAASDYALSCDAEGARDAAFTFRLPAARDVYIVARGILEDGQEEIASVALFDECGDPKSERQCTQGFPADLRVRALAKGRHYLVASSPGAVRIVLSISFLPRTAPPPNTSCQHATDVSAGGTFISDFVDVLDVFTHTCSAEGRPDLFYALTLTEPRNLDVSAITSEGGQLTVTLLDGCAATDALRCAIGDPVQSRFYALAAGNYVLVVEGPATREVAFSLNVVSSAPTPAPEGDACSEPGIVMAGQGVRPTLGDKTDDVSTSCGLGGADAVFRLRVVRATDLEIEVDADDEVASVALQRSCGEADSEVTCERGARLQTRVRDVAPGDYYVVVDAPGAQAFTLDIDELPRTQPVNVAGNDGCGNAFEIPESGGLFRGDTRELFDRYEGYCSGGGPANDASFRLVLTQPRRVQMRVEATFDAVLYRYGSDDTSAACDDATAASCDDDSGAGGQPELDEVLAAGTHYYIVDAWSAGYAGGFVLDVNVTDP
jgi:hypothetical protein